MFEFEFWLGLDLVVGGAGFVVVVRWGIVVGLVVLGSSD